MQCGSIAVALWPSAHKLLRKRKKNLITVIEMPNCLQVDGCHDLGIKCPGLSPHELVTETARKCDHSQSILYLHDKETLRTEF
jgi:hypothetical protein